MHELLCNHTDFSIFNNASVMGWRSVYGKSTGTGSKPPSTTPYYRESKITPLVVTGNGEMKVSKMYHTDCKYRCECTVQSWPPCCVTDNVPCGHDDHAVSQITTDMLHLSKSLSGTWHETHLVHQIWYLRF